jgi:polysaccharide pyruvyl transferase WcaK-like protein
MLRYIAKQASLLLPPVRLLYQEVLLANARSAELLRAITREKNRVSVLGELLRQARERNARLETDRTRTEEDRAAREVRFLERTAGLEELLRQVRERNVRLEADRGTTGKAQALHGAEFGGREGIEVLISGASGQPNYGDEQIAISVGKFHKRRGNTLWVNSFNPSIAVGCASLAGIGASRVRNIDYLWASIPPGKIDSIGSAIKCGLALFDSEFEGTARHFLDLLGTVKTVHFHGGGYLNSIWPHSAFQIGAGLAMKKKFGTRLVATGIGLMPLSKADRAALAEAVAAFDGFECRDRESADALTSYGAKVEAGVDDVFLEVQASPLAPGAVPDLHLCLQFGEWDETRQEKTLNRLVPFLKNNLNEIGSIVWWEFCPKSDLRLLDHPSLREIKDRFVVRRFGELMRSGLQARIGDLAIVSRFHAHLLLLRAGVRGILIVEDGLNFGNDYYQTKHQSLLDTGSNWLFLDKIERFDIGAFAPIPNWKEFNAQNERKKRECYERLLLDPP